MATSCSNLHWLPIRKCVENYVLLLQVRVLAFSFYFTHPNARSCTTCYNAIVAINRQKRFSMHILNVFILFSKHFVYVTSVTPTYNTLLAFLRSFQFSVYKLMSILVELAVWLLAFLVFFFVCLFVGFLRFFYRNLVLVSRNWHLPLSPGRLIIFLWQSLSMLALFNLHDKRQFCRTWRATARQVVLSHHLQVYGHKLKIFANT